MTHIYLLGITTMSYSMSYSVLDERTDDILSEEDEELSDTENPRPRGSDHIREDHIRDIQCDSVVSLYHKYVTMGNAICCIVIIELIIFTYWITTYEFVWKHAEIPEGSGSANVLVDKNTVPDYSFLSASVSLERTPYSSYHNTTYVGKSADEFIEFLGIFLLIYLCIKCTFGKDTYK